MKLFVFACMIGAAMAQRVTTVTTTVFMYPYITTTIVGGTETVGVTVPVTLPVSTSTYHYSQYTPTETVTVDAGSVSTSTVNLGKVVTTTVGESTVVVSGIVTVVVTETAAASTAFVTMTGTATATVTVTGSGLYTTINSCVPTTTIISTVTTSAPTPTSPVGSVVVYQKRDCSVVICPSGRKTATTNGAPKTCMLTYSGAALISSTCLVDYCCTAASGMSLPVIRYTNCLAAGVVCDDGKLLSSKSGVYVPCLQYYMNGELSINGCSAATCCSAGTAGGTGATVTVRPTSKKVSCRNVVKCKVYKKDPETNYILKCNKNRCNTALCCQS